MSGAAMAIRRQDKFSSIAGLSRHFQAAATACISDFETRIFNHGCLAFWSRVRYEEAERKIDVRSTNRNAAYY